jgi:hypothetical protein
MTHAEALDLIHAQLQRTNALYGGVVFDEWALLGLDPQQGASVLGYQGPRPDKFADQLAIDARALREAAANKSYEVGDFEFVHEAEGTDMDAFMRVGDATYLVCNHTAGTMTEVRRDPRWRLAQVGWVNLADKFRADPVV